MSKVLVGVLSISNRLLGWPSRLTRPHPFPLCREPYNPAVEIFPGDSELAVASRVDAGGWNAAAAGPKSRKETLKRLCSWFMPASLAA